MKEEKNMLDPVSALATASAAFNVIKRGFEVGRDIEQMAGDLGRWMGAMSDLTEAEYQAKNPPIFKKLFKGKSIEQEAMETFAAKKKAEQMREELKNYIGFTMGKRAWEELLAMEGRIRKERQETLYNQERRRQRFMEVLVVSIAIGIGIALLTTAALVLK